MKLVLRSAFVAFCLVEAATDVEVALSSNDECTGETCALNALQRRQRLEQLIANDPEIGPPFVTCDPLCHDGGLGPPAKEENATTAAEDTDLGSSYEDLGAGPPATEEHATTAESTELGTYYRGPYIRHYTQNCWYGCGRRAGDCPGFCGAGNACCRWHAHHDPAECRGVRRWPVIHWHTCVTPSHWTPGPSPSSGMGQANCNNVRGNAVMTVYHQTGCDIGPLILKEGFHLGKVGWCGGGIYFAMSPKATMTKAIGPDSHKGFMIEAQVRMGNVAHGNDQCQMNGNHLDANSVHGQGLDSVIFNPGDGDELIVYCASQVLSAKAYPWKCS